MKALAWGITGAGHQLVETFSIMRKLAKRVPITSFLSSAGAEVVKMYGLWHALREISPGSYLQEAYAEPELGASSPKVGRFLRGAYFALVVAPASANTVAKIAHGIADTLVTNAVAQARKADIPVFVLPTDQAEVVETTLPLFVDKELCRACAPCKPAASCHTKAFVIGEYVYINLLNCRGCGSCVKLCPYGAIIGGKRVKVKVRRVDLENVEKLRAMEGMMVLREPREIEREILKLL